MFEQLEASFNPIPSVVRGQLDDGVSWDVDSNKVCDLTNIVGSAHEIAVQQLQRRHVRYDQHWQCLLFDGDCHLLQTLQQVFERLSTREPPLERRLEPVGVSGFMVSDACSAADNSEGVKRLHVVLAFVCGIDHSIVAALMAMAMAMATARK